MVATRKFHRRKKALGGGIAHAGQGWKLEDAKARFSEVFRQPKNHLFNPWET